MVTAHLCFGYFLQILGSKKLYFSIYLQLHPANVHSFFHKTFHINTLSRPMLNLRQKNYCFNFYPNAIFRTSLAHVFRNLQNQHFYPIFGPQNYNLPGVSECFPFGCILGQHWSFHFEKNF